MYAMSRGSTWANTAKVLDEDLISKADFSKKGRRFLMDKQIFLYIYMSLSSLFAQTPHHVPRVRRRLTGYLRPSQS